jgi:P27 family predicted phage terminase small subunit
MATRGRKPKPTALKLLAGDRRDRINLREAAPDGVAPTKPAGLQLDDVKKPSAIQVAVSAKWDQMVEELRAVRVLSAADGHALAIYCAAYGRWVEAQNEIAIRGVLIDTKNGRSRLGSVCKKNPAVDVSTSAEAIMLRILTEFGLTPSSRARIPASVTTTDTLSDFLAEAK